MQVAAKVAADPSMTSKSCPRHIIMIRSFDIRSCTRRGFRTTGHRSATFRTDLGATFCLPAVGCVIYHWVDLHLRRLLRSGRNSRPAHVFLSFYLSALCADTVHLFAMYAGSSIAYLPCNVDTLFLYHALVAMCTFGRRVAAAAPLWAQRQAWAPALPALLAELGAGAATSERSRTRPGSLPELQLQPLVGSGRARNFCIVRGGGAWEPGHSARFMSHKVARLASEAALRGRVPDGFR